MGEKTSMTSKDSGTIESLCHEPQQATTDHDSLRTTNTPGVAVP